MNELLDLQSGLTIRQRKPWLRDLPRTARLLAEVAGIPVPDALGMLGRTQGMVLVENLRQDVAREFAACLEAEGLAVELLEPHQVIRLEALGSVRELELHPDGLLVRLVPAELVLDWNDIALISVAQCEVVVDVDSEMKRPSPRAMEVRFDRFEVTGVELRVDLFEFGGRFVTLSPKRLTYRHLGADMAPAARPNFMRTLRLIVPRCPRAVLLGVPALMDDDVEPPPCELEEHLTICRDLLQGMQG